MSAPLTRLQCVAVASVARDELAALAESVGGRVGDRAVPASLLGPSSWPVAVTQTAREFRAVAGHARTAHRRALQAVAAVIGNDRAAALEHCRGAREAHERAWLHGVRFLDRLEAVIERLAPRAP